MFVDAVINSKPTKGTMVGEWRGEVNLVMVRMDDFDVVLGMEFLLEYEVIPMPLAQCLTLTSSNPTVVQAKIKQPSGLRMISVLQLEKGPSREEMTFMAISMVDEQIEAEPVPIEI
ncbi:Asp_protease_2 domain-containing protein [Cucumis melo var. makuwa]|uniref:Asp_protease_2 domain-containing protein n=1 Tax=Cucumis melo var. makuwa TaxID=1194695 RepID=A0A5D3C0H2_CUCMM|nr:Asp_protease_2 domain-containing protein [Cucumis melo var. makuwa]